MRLRSILLGIPALLWSASALRADDWPQWRGPTRDGVWRENGLLEKFPDEGLKVRWRMPVGIGWSSPVVAAGRVYVVDCVLGPKEKLMARERVHCFDEASGKELWTFGSDAEYPDYAWPPMANPGQGPCSTPLVHDGVIYAVGAMGHLHALDARSGDLIWKRDLAKDYKVAQFCIRGSPLMEGELLIVPMGYSGAPGVVAFHRKDGTQAWAALENGGYNSSPLVVSASGTRQLVVSTRDPESVSSLDPLTGALLWKEKYFCGIPTPVQSGDRLLVNGLMLQLEAGRPAATVLWPARKPEADFSDTTSAVLRGDWIFTHKKPDRLVCLDARTGKAAWVGDQVKSSLHSLTLCGDALFIFTAQGELIRAEASGEGYRERSRTLLIKPTGRDPKPVVYAAPAYANRCVFARNDEELICASLAADP